MADEPLSDAVMCGHHWRDKRGDEHDCYLPPGHQTRHWCTCGIEDPSR